MSTGSVYLAMAALMLALPSVAAEKAALPKDLPPYGPMQPVKTPEVKQLKLDNGLTVWLVPEVGFPKVAITIAVRAGYVTDPKDYPGMADLLAATVTQGTSSYTSKELAERIASAGGDLTAEASADSIIIDTSVLSSKTDIALGLLADVMRNATFTNTEVAIAKNNLISQIESNEAQPWFLSRRALYRLMYGDHPYAIISPTKESVTKTSPEDLKREYTRRFRPDRSLLVVVGDFDSQTVRPVIESAFGPWKATGEAAAINDDKPPHSVSRAIVFVPRPNSVQTTFLLGEYGPARSDPDYAATRVATAIYGGMFGSRLIQNIREDKGYTYSPGAFLSLHRQAGLLLTSADVRNAVTGASFNEIEYELNRMATTAPEEAEVESAKRYILGSTAISLQSQQSVTRSLARLWVDSLPPEELGRQLQKVVSVKADEVEAVGRKYFPAWRSAVVAVGEEKVIREELSPFGLEFQKAQ